MQVRVAAQAAAIGDRDPALWDQPLVFDPGHFSPENSTGRDRWQYLPFGAGPRSCIGDHFAMLEATLALATIVRDREIRSTGAGFPLIVPLTMVAAAPIPARVTGRGLLPTTARNRIQTMHRGQGVSDAANR